jgi:hypothetical protein
MPSAIQRRLVICAKSTWEPAIRREHALARVAGAAGIEVTFIERPRDVRALRSIAGARTWAAGLRATPAARVVAPGVRALETSVLVPGHRDAFAQRTSAVLLTRVLRAIPGLDSATVVAQLPWQWPAVSAAPAGRRVLDVADDWSRLMPGRTGRIDQLLARIDAEADAVILVDPAMSARFPSQRPVVVRNGVAEELLSALVAPPGTRTMVWAGTLSERFDGTLAREVLDRAPEWRLELYGQCQYAGLGEMPGEELTKLLAAHPGRVRHHGVVPRARLAAAIDTGAVAVIFNRSGMTRGQDSMKLYDYAARGRPIVATSFANTTSAEAPPHLRLADTADEVVTALEQSLGEPPAWAHERRRWAEDQRWERRWPAWSAAAFGETDG